MTRINKQVIVDYFKTFFGQYRLTKEHFTKIRNLVDDAECGCCSVVSVYWVGESEAAPSAEQVLFKDTDDNIIAATSLIGSSPQRICVPREATQICVNIVETVTTGGTFTVDGTDGFSFGGSDTISETCTDITFPFADAYIVSMTEPG